MQYAAHDARKKRYRPRLLPACRRAFLASRRPVASSGFFRKTLESIYWRRRAGGGRGPARERVSGRASCRRVRQRQGAAAAASGSGRGPRRRHPAGDSRAAGRKARRGKEIGFGTDDPSAPDALKSQPPPGRYAGAPLRAALFPPGRGAGRKDRMSCRSLAARGPFTSPFHRAALNRSEPRPGAAARGPFTSPFHSSTPEPGQGPPLGLRLERGHDFAKHVAALPEKRRGVLV